jgi:hypothetical protein
MGISMSMGAALEPNRYQGPLTKTVTFAGATPNAIGDFDGTSKTVNLFTVTGDVVIRLIAVCTTDVTHAANATIEVGIGAGSQIIATTNLTTQEMTAREIWHDATPDSEIEAISVFKDMFITDGNDIQLDTDVANTNTGVIVFYLYWYPVSSGALVVAA